MRTGLAALMIAGSALAACAPPAVQAPGPTTAAPPPRPYSPTGLESVLGQTFRSLVAQFGQPDLDLTEGPARKLQFLGPACVLDAYLYPPRGGRGEPVVTHVDARLPDGREMDRSSCVAALNQRTQAR
ncbi:hypothetical protein RCO27_10575 [Sphingosinicella sp. LHD-64]|uniref:hypothetical protein n=1 Tax=Sphingosinicella sp. LHD-64 TaxID=3072139 RepID=UPI00280FBD2E|nr:hypothetical protein [Sphingosinicella sp. LHD-64]MDQ8756678.1 hypothetical protein [Sphingosinicella sp. LHD-64]